MKITRVEAFHVQWRADVSHGWGARSPWVRIWTDGGLSGIGEMSPMGESGNASLEIIASSFAPRLAGADPLDSAVLFHTLFHRDLKLGPDGAFAAALAAVDIALWDLKGKILGQPIYKLLGGAWRTRLPFYASIGGNGQRTVDEVCKAVERWLPLKPAAIKIRFDPDKTTRDVDLRGDIAKARAVRRLVGDDMMLAFDANNGYSVQGAIRVGRALEDLGYEWLEEPVQSYHHAALEKVAHALDLAVAAGEQEYTAQGIARLIDAGASIVQPDIVKTGGFTGLLDMAALARTAGVDFLPHQTQPLLGHTANLHLMASTLHARYPVECNEISQLQNVVFSETPQLADGLFHLPTAPGLGLELLEHELSPRRIPWRGLSA